MNIGAASQMDDLGGHLGLFKQLTDINGNFRLFRQPNVWFLNHSIVIIFFGEITILVLCNELIS